MFLYETLYVLMVAGSVVFNEPLFTAIFWVEVFTFQSSQTVVNAILSKVLEMLMTLVLGIAIMYIWMVLGIILFRHTHEPDDNNICTNMFQCVLAYIFVALRGDGVKDLMGDLDIPLNVIDSVLPENGFFLPLLLWDFAYNWLFIYVLLAIITGIVIDAFGGLRDEKDAAEQDLRAVCFVCNLPRFNIDQGGIGFDKHVKTEHNPHWYLFFLIYLRRRSPGQLSTQEKYVLHKVWPASGNPQYDWIPRERCFSIQSGEEGDNAMAKLEHQVNSVEAKVDKMSSSLVRIEELLANMGKGDDEILNERKGT